jgi:serine/tyrosine/threonine adenylyltransferase
VDATFGGAPLSAVRFDNLFTRSLPGDRSLVRDARAVSGACYSSIAPVAVEAPSLVAHAHEVGTLLAFPPGLLASEAFVAVLAGNAVLPGMEPYAARYGGHQFGDWAGQLGDGRAITLGEVVTPHDERFELQLKGAGRTPYSRSGDGRAVLRSSIREFLASEALHHLGVPTTRALGLVATGEAVERDMLYDGHPREEPGAIVCRVAPSFLRFGSFELLTARDELGLLEQLTDFTLDTYFPELGHGRGKRERYVALFHEICRRTALLVAHWMRVGFVHGVMNTDNMSVLGLTIDYGPFGFLDHYARDFTPNTSDLSGRYRYAAQPSVAKWNLLKLAESLFPLIRGVEPLQAGLAVYDATFADQHRRMLAEKLGIDGGPRDDDRTDSLSLPRLVDDLFALFELGETDFTCFFRGLAEVPTAEAAKDESRLATLAGAYYGAPDAFPPELRASTLAWLERYTQRVRQDGRPGGERVARMQTHNPCYVLRNYQAQLVIDAATAGDYAPLHELQDVLRRPYTAQPGRERFAEKRPEWARERVGCSQLSCSS